MSEKNLQITMLVVLPMVLVLRKVVVIGLLLIILALAAFPSLGANPGVHASVLGAPLSVGEAVHITFYTNVGEDGTASVYIKSPGGGADIWDSGPIHITGGLAYEQVAPGLTSPGTYIAGATVWLGAIPGPTISAETAFQVVGGTTVTATMFTVIFDFTIALSPPSLSVKQGETATYQILLSYSDPSYSGTTITVDVQGLGPGMNYQLIPSLPMLKVATSESTPVGSYTIILIGSAMGRIHQTSAQLIVQPKEQPFDFSLSASPPQQTVTPGDSTTFTISVNLAAGSAQSVTLSVTGAPSGVSASLDPQSGTPSFNSILSVTTTSSVSPGQYVLTVQGTVGAKAHSTTVTLVVGQSPDFRIDVTPPSQTSSQGQTASYSVNVVSLNGFSLQVSLSLSGLPSGIGGGSRFHPPYPFSQPP